MKPKAMIQCVLIVCALFLVGCKNNTNSTDSGSSPSGNATTDNGANSSTANNPSAQNSAQQASPSDANGSSSSASSKPLGFLAPKPIVVKAGNKIVITADEPVSSKTSSPGDHFDASIAEPVVVGDKVVIPKGSKATGTVTEAKSAGKFKGNAAISLTLSSVTVHGEEYRLKTTEVTESGKGRGKRTAVGAGGGAAVGAIIGALAGGGKGAAIGAGAGAGAGTAGAAFTGDKDITIRPETKLTFELSEPLEVKKK